MFNGKVLLITGGTGSFGNAVVKRFLDTQIAEIRIFSRDEKKQDDMRHLLPSKKMKFYIGDARDPGSIESAMSGADFVFHAAALKQVPSCEFYPIEAVKTNILGTENVLNAAIKHSVSKLICLSTDKAVYPINAMGMSKALMEKTVFAKARFGGSKGPTFCVTRYGNVMASRGSVIPLFINQIINKQNISVTDPDMTRFMMSLDEAVDLVLFAFSNGKQGDLFVQKSPASTVGDVAHALKDIFKSSSIIKIMGTRHGEKKHETLLSREEHLKSIDLENYYRVPLDDRDLNYNLYFSEGQTELNRSESYSSDNTVRLSLQQTKALLEKVDYVQDMKVNKSFN